MPSSDLSRAILVWRFGDAPAELQKLSTNGGDEDWLVLLPPKFEHDDGWWAPWLDKIDTCDEPDRFELPDGSVVYIGSHA